MKIGIGTVQFGLDYGISNREGQTSAEEVVRILDVAARSGIRLLDTAALYGASEAVLGQSLPFNHAFNIVTKTIQFSKPCITPNDVQRLEDVFFQSLKKLKQSSVYGLLIHHAGDLLVENGDLLMEKILSFKQLGLVKKIGVSIYTGEQIDQILDRYEVDIMQLPLNILDQRLLQRGYLSRLKKGGVEIHCRSPFLQGLLLMDPESLLCYSFSERIMEHLRSYHDFIQEAGVLPVQAAIGFVNDIEEVDHVICGVNNQKQLQEVCSVNEIRIQSPDYFQFAIRDESVLNPAKWNHAQ